MAFYFIFRFPQLFIVFLGFSGFPQLPKGLFRFPQILNFVFWFPPQFPIFPGFRGLEIAFPLSDTDVFSGFPRDLFGFSGFPWLFLRLFRLSAKSIPSPLIRSCTFLNTPKFKALGYEPSPHSYFKAVFLSFQVFLKQWKSHNDLAEIWPKLRLSNREMYGISIY